MASGASAGDDIRLEAFNPGGIAEIRLFGDGRLTSRVEISGSTVGTVTVPAAEHAIFATLTAVAVDKAGLVSAPVVVPGQKATGKQSGRLLALAVGVDRYPQMPPVCGWDDNQSCDLSYSAADARRVIAAVSRSPLYAARVVTVLTDQRASRDAILARLDRLIDRATEADTLLVSFAGHGLIDRNNGLQLGLSSTRLDRFENTSLGFDLVARRLRRSKARVVVLLDVCHAGLAGRADAATNDAAASHLITSSGASMVVLSASKGRQFSEEAASAAGGLFSAAFDRIVSGERAAVDSDGNGAISISELYRGLKATVVRASQGRQTPWLSRNLVAGDFDLF